MTNALTPSSSPGAPATRVSDVAPPPLETLVPADKKLDPAWVRSLFERGTPAVYRGDELRYIGMPVGGIACGQLYLGGDGRLWHWDIFNQRISTGDGHYARPMKPASPLDQGFAVHIRAGARDEIRALDRSGFADIAFRGEYPIGIVEYRDPATPLTVRLEAFSPFIPLNAADSALPATVLQFTLRNTGDQPLEATLAGWLENAVCLHSGLPGLGLRRNTLAPAEQWRFLECRAVPRPLDDRRDKRPDILFEDFEKPTYEGWTVTGTAFGDGPVEISKVPAYQGDLGGKGRRVVNSHASAPGDNVGQRDAATGTLTSKPFVIERDYITLLIGGGAHQGRTCVNLLIDDKVAASATGRNNNRMEPHTFDVRPWAGKTARIQIVDNEKGGWGNIGADHIVFTDQPHSSVPALSDQPDFGTLVLGLAGPRDGLEGAAGLPPGPRPQTLFAPAGGLLATDVREAETPLDQKPVGAVARRVVLAPGAQTTVTFVLAWHFPNLRLKDGGRFYATRFGSALEVGQYILDNFERLSGRTRLWRDTWYDSTLPYWFLDRTFLNTSTLATSTAHWFKTGRFYGWEGVGCCEGTCTHVWHYAHAVARLFPELERDLRRRTDFGTAINLSTGVINHRGEGAGLAVDGQAGCILRAWREHQMSADDSFLRSLWPRIKLAMDALRKLDRGEGLLEGAQHNTLDQPWFGRIAWLSSLYLAAARACEEMARELGDNDYAQQMRQLFEKGSRNLDRQLFNGEYYIQIADPEHRGSVGSHDGCEVDQVFGQSWAHQVGLGRILPPEHVVSALRSLWKYNFAPDVGPYRAVFKPGRWYAMPGEAGLIMCTWPRGTAQRGSGGFDYYLNECMNGFEYQVAGHMLWEGLIQEGMAITRAIHDRHHPSKRNPWNEVECGDHYARSMASYGVFLAACGFEYHGPRGHMGFAPRLSPEDFRAAFTAAEGWGTIAQQRRPGQQINTVQVKFGQLRLKTLAFELPRGAVAGKTAVSLAGEPLPASAAQSDTRVLIALERPATIPEGKALEVRISF